MLRPGELRGDGPYAVSARGLELVLVRTKAGLRAFQGRCPHQGALLGEGEVFVAGAVANEAMRLRPVAPLLFNETNVETVLGDVVLPAGTQVVVLTRPPVRDESHFHDPDSFRPERWLDGGAGAHEASTHIPFGSGPRLCPGRTLALLGMKVVLATLYKSFEVVREGPTDAVRESFAFTMSPVGLEVRVRPRS